MRYESLTTGQTNPLLAAIRNLPDDLPSDNVGLLARLTGGETEGETGPVITDPAPDPVEQGPLVFEIPMGHFPLSMSIWSYEKMDSSGLEYGGDEISYGVTMNFPEGWRENEPWPSRVPANPEAIDEVESIVEAALETLPNVANAEVTIIVEGYRSHRPTPFDPDHDVILDLWRIELTEGPGGIVSIRPSSTALLYTINGKPGIRIYFPMEQGAALLTGGDTEAVTTDPDPEPEPAPAPDPLVFEIPAGNYTHMGFEVFVSLGAGQPSVNKAYVNLTFDSLRPYFRDWYDGGPERLDYRTHREYDNPRRAIEEALASLPNVASAEVTFFADKWRIELTPGPGGITHLYIRPQPGTELWGAYEPIEQGAETDLTPALRDPPPAPELTPDPAGETSPAPGALVFEIVYTRYIHWMVFTAYPDGHEPGDPVADDYRADIDLVYLHANGEAVPYGGEVVRGALAVHRLYADPADRIKAALEALPNVATAKLTLIGLDEGHGRGKAWRIEITEGPGGVEKLSYVAGDFSGGGGKWTGAGGELTPIEGDARRATWAVDDNLEGGSGDDTLDGGSGDDTIDGAGGGDDKLYGGEGNDELRGGDGDNRLSGGPGDDTLYGDGAGDELYGGPGDDTLYGGAGDDQELYGGPGDDKLYSGGGDALLSGGPGDDLLTGGGGADTFRFAPGHSSGGDGDVITDFDYAAGDMLMLTGFSSGDPTLSNRQDADGDGASDDRVITLPDGGEIALLNVGDAVFALDNIII